MKIVIIICLLLASTNAQAQTPVEQIRNTKNYQISLMGINNRVSDENIGIVVANPNVVRVYRNSGGISRAKSACAGGQCAVRKKRSGGKCGCRK